MSIVLVLLLLLRHNVQSLHIHAQFIMWVTLGG